MDGDAALAAAYLGTTWSVRAAGGTHRLAPGRPLPAGLPACAIITAYNPASTCCSRAENRAALRRLRARLGVPWLPARAHGRPREWDEPGFALIGADVLPVAVALGTEFGQNAIVWADMRGVRIVVTRPGFHGLAPGDELRAR
ncbi:MAG TPA: DUF3293 domain-containing protein [Longimicrobium sp.]|nr:DUF3293 domain-containing protein [Longimicrobium sp.]